ncbi:hypothetical protein TKK_0001404 [Trichogramma kaykai]|uniref:Fe2OG dioxygenase domain-containing protein n=1 Tax=Trichogramma kaykai TaxID=54128 RepID=A0ABD2X1R5_9HYME
MPNFSAGRFYFLSLLLELLLTKYLPDRRLIPRYVNCRGLWNVPFISNCYLVNATLLAHEDTRPVYEDPELDPDMSFASAYRRRNVFMYVSNRLDFGHLVNPDSYNVSLTHPDMYQLFDNKLDWEKRYVHENYSKNFEADRAPLQPCPDVFWFPILTRRFTKEWINIMENYGKWSDGSNYDPRLSDGYENVPTRDIHMNQVGLEAQWLYFLQNYVRPLQELVYLGYYHFDSRLENGYEAVPTRDIHMTQVGLDPLWLEFLRVYVSPLQQRAFTGYLDYPPRSLMNFVVRYRPDEQPSLKPHHDSSTYTINVALNEVGVDYEGGGCRFIRYNCSVTDTKPGWMLMHPGRLTHYHEGLRVTKGTRYIMISFVDP